MYVYIYCLLQGLLLLILIGISTLLVIDFRLDNITLTGNVIVDENVAFSELFVKSPWPIMHMMIPGLFTLFVTFYIYVKYKSKGHFVAIFLTLATTILLTTILDIVEQLIVSEILKIFIGYNWFSETGFNLSFDILQSILGSLLGIWCSLIIPFPSIVEMFDYRSKFNNALYLIICIVLIPITSLVSSVKKDIGIILNVGFWGYLVILIILVGFLFFIDIFVYIPPLKFNFKDRISFYLISIVFISIFWIMSLDLIYYTFLSSLASAIIILVVVISISKIIKLKKKY